MGFSKCILHPLTFFFIGRKPNCWLLGKTDFTNCEMRHSWSPGTLLLVLKANKCQS